MMKDIVFAIWFFLPVGLANSAPIYIAAIPVLKKFSYPMDFHATWRGKRVFGSHKTFRGLLAGILLAILTVWLQKYLYNHIETLKYVIPAEYQEMDAVIFGTLAALGALLGDAIESFFKRQVGVKPGKSWFPFDQLDYIIGGIIATAFYTVLPVTIYGWIIIIWFGLHLIFSWIGYMVGLKESPL